MKLLLILVSSVFTKGGQNQTNVKGKKGGETKVEKK